MMWRERPGGLPADGKAAAHLIAYSREKDCLHDTIVRTRHGMATADFVGFLYKSMPRRL